MSTSSFAIVSPVSAADHEVCCEQDNKRGKALIKGHLVWRKERGSHSFEAVAQNSLCFNNELENGAAAYPAKNCEIILIRFPFKGKQ